MVGLVLVPVLLLSGVELALRLAGYGYPTSFFKKMEIGGQEYWVDNDTFGFRFFPPALARIPAPVVMKAKKPPGSIRIFIFGESATMGDPQPHYGAGRYLETLLHARYPETSFEVVNTSMIAINSHVILPIARECAGHEGDLWIVYMGNNEMVGPFGAATVFGQKAPPLALVRLNLAIQRSRVGQLLLALSHRLHKSNEASWRGMEMFLENKIPPGDPRKEVVYRSYSRNLEDILKAGAGAGAKIILSTVAVNLKDCPPFASLPETELAAATCPSYDSLHAAGAAALEHHDWSAAEQSLAKAASLFPRSADAQFLLAEALLRETNDPSAREHFEQAVEDDMLPFRAGFGASTASSERKGRGSPIAGLSCRMRWLPSPPMARLEFPEQTFSTSTCILTLTETTAWRAPGLKPRKKSCKRGCPISRSQRGRSRNNASECWA